MNNFGFHIVPSSTINLDTADVSKFNLIRAVEPDVMRCMSCGSCSATCPAGNFSGMSVRKLILNLERGREEEVVKMVRSCMLCGKCLMVCPRGLNTRRIILAACRVCGDKPQEKSSEL
ncbi:MAG: 4Fe-4S dicluster domain-containing protein [Bacteroidales bacterium]|nr:4Fe-4S dicluster domain-containing protein [Bacteroidales bacterium]